MNTGFKTAIQMGLRDGSKFRKSGKLAEGYTPNYKGRYAGIRKEKGIGKAVNFTYRTSVRAGLHPKRATATTIATASIGGGAYRRSTHKGIDAK